MSIYTRAVSDPRHHFDGGGAGYYIGKYGVPPQLMDALPKTVGAKLQLASNKLETTDAPKPKEPKGPVVYYRAPGNAAAFSAKPMKDAKGTDYSAVHANEDVSLDPKEPEAAGTVVGALKRLSKASGKSNITATRWACRTHRPCRRKTRWAWTIFLSTRVTTAMTARSS